MVIMTQLRQQPRQQRRRRLQRSFSSSLSDVFLMYAVAVVGLFTTTTTTVTAAAAKSATPAEELIAWITSKENGGYYNPKQQQVQHHEGYGGSGIVTTEDIATNEILVSIPLKLIVGHEGYNKWRNKEDKKIVNGVNEDDDEPQYIDEEEYMADIVATEDCYAIRALLKEVRLGSNSKYAPYLQYLNLLAAESEQEKEKSTNTNVVNLIPTVWSTEGKHLLESIMGDKGTGLPPYHAMFTLLNHDKYGKCVIDILSSSKLNAGQEDENIHDILVRHAISTVVASSSSLSPPQSLLLPEHRQRPPMHKQKSHHDRGLLIPLLDNAHYEHGRVPNVKGRMSKSKYDLIATQPIPKGTTILRSYTNDYRIGSGTDEDTEDDNDQEGDIDAEHCATTSDIFRDYGVIETQYPQVFRFEIDSAAARHGHGGAMGVEKEIYTFITDLTIDESGEELYELTPILDDGEVVDWTNDVLPYMVDKLYHLNKVERMKIDFNNNNNKDTTNEDATNSMLTHHEWKTAWNYHQVLKDTTKQIIQFIHNEDEDEYGSADSVIKSRLPSIPDKMALITKALDFDESNPYGPSDFAYQMCNDEDITEWDEYKSVWGQSQPSIQSHYQEIFFFHHPQTKDMCMKLDGTVQQCTSYRPHYHEFAVHFPSRFIDSVERVLFVGGGDSMVLHDVLKYPSLELVLGLELDQFVVRNSFKYFHTQPHFDDKRVQWWFGDGAKSLLMLPKSYFGSFDLIVIDLSETVMSFQVTDKLSIFQTLSLLLKPEGIMLKNGEYYMDSMSSHFDYTLQYFEYDVPFICDQGMVIGSNNLDFFNSTGMKDHGVETYVYEPQDKILDTNGTFHRFTEYRKNNAREQGQCQKMSDADIYDGGERKQAGILMVVEGEKLGESSDITIDKESISVTLKSIGLTPLSTVADVSSDGKVSTIIVIMEEGYITARIWPELSYCALDIQLWGGFQLMDDTKTALIASFGGAESSTSSFRLVDGGMYGSSTAQQDLAIIGPRIANTRHCDDDDDDDDDEIEANTCNDESGTCTNPDAAAANRDDTEKIMIEETLSLSGETENNNAVVAVICGKKGQSCKTFDVLKRSSSIKQILPLYTCPDSGDLTDCEVDTFKTLLNMGKLSLLIIDTSVEQVMLEILLSIFGDVWNRNRLITSDRFSIVVPATLPTEGQVLRKYNRRNFLVLVRQEVVYSPMTLADVVVKTKGKTTTGPTVESMSILSLNDSKFFNNLHGMVSNFNKRTATAKEIMEVKSVYDGLVRPQLGPFRPKIFKPDDYDLSAGKEQLAGQKSLGRQSLYQFDITNYQSVPSVALPSVMTNSIFGMGWTVKQDIGQYVDGIGDGAVFVGIISGGNVVVVWDGKNHIDVNLFTLDDNEQLRSKFSNQFLRHLKMETRGTVTLALSDTHPRGTGRVVSFPKGN